MLLTRLFVVVVVAIASLSAQSARAQESGAEVMDPSDAERESDAPSELRVTAALMDCREKLLAHDVTASFCYRAIADDARTPPEDAAVAAVLADVATDLSSPAVVEGAGAGEAVSVSALVESGAPELVLSSSAYGGVAGFLGAATLLSATRISEFDSLPWLVGAPAFGILAGGAAASAVAYGLPLDAGDAALVSSNLWLGSAWGFSLQLIIFDQRDDVGHIPLRFASILASGLGLGALGAAAAWGLDVDPGDVGLMNSAALWGPTLASLTWLTLATAGNFGEGPGAPTDLPSVVTLLLASSILPWSATFALHPFLDVERPATWLIEAGGVTGLFSGLALMTLLSTSGLPAYAFPAILTTTTALGVVSGTAVAFLVSDALAGLDMAALTGPLFSLTPALIPPAPGREDAAPGLFAVARF